MELFENMLLLLVLAVVLLQLSRRLSLPYPAMLALAGGLTGALPWAPQVSIEPHLALALFIAPALLDAAYDTAPRELSRNWLPLLALAVVAVLLTTAVVAWAGWALAGLPLAAAITLGAIVAPPDAVAGATVMQQFRLPRRTMAIINGESLLNDAVALLIFGAASAAALLPQHSFAAQIPLLLLAVPGGAILGYLLGKLFVHMAPAVAGTMSSTIVEFVLTFGTWMLAERLHVSPIIAVVAFGMTVARYLPARSTPRDRVHSYSVWGAAVFVLNVLAFLLMGLQARSILSKLTGSALTEALVFAGVVVVLVIAVRVAWVMSYGALVRRFGPGMARRGLDVPLPSRRTGMLVSWSGMRGLVTLATAFALPDQFPGRDQIVLTAFAVVLGTLIVQGLTIGPLISVLKIEEDHSLEHEISKARGKMIDAALSSMDRLARSTAAARNIADEYRAARKAALDLGNPQGSTEYDHLRLQAIRAQRLLLNSLRDRGQIEDDVYHRLEEELDWAELHAASTGETRLLSV
ncbi:cation:proton antiporter [Paucibacter sp. O1-1]|nr:cation:proton antiporter [Paucibacter sp. O1-1]MDA3825691.1 cation:proton antiporter [Paucibacter sp. O1-1]